MKLIGRSILPFIQNVRASGKVHYSVACFQER
jgi:hypothetical protein